MTLSGPIALSGRLPPAAATPASAAARDAAPAAAAAAGPIEISAKADLRGQLDVAAALGRSASRRQADAARPVRIGLDADARLGPAGAIDVALHDAAAVAGQASAKLAGTLRRSGDAAPFAIAAKVELDRFRSAQLVDRRPALGAGARPAPDQCAAPMSTCASMPAAGRQRRRQQRRRRRLAPTRWRRCSRCSSSPRQGRPGAAPERRRRHRDRRHGALRVDGATPGPGEADARLSLQAAGNQLEASLHARADRPAADRLQLTLNAPALERLAPLAALSGMPAPPRPPHRQAARRARPVARRWPASCS